LFLKHDSAAKSIDEELDNDLLFEQGEDEDGEGDRKMGTEKGKMTILSLSPPPRDNNSKGQWRPPSLELLT
jgi:hypothetical protein